jgi:hypothetical protein
VITARAFWSTQARRGEIRVESLPPPGDGMLALWSIASGVSRGTEALVFAGRVPISQYDVMRAPLMAGAFPFPVKYGYALVARRTDGARVFTLHPHQDRCVVPAAMAVPVPEDLPSSRAVLGANMETALNITWDAAALPGERIAVIGAGVIGLLTASLLAKLPGTLVTVIDINPARARLAAAFGCAFATPDAAPDEQDLVVHSSASEAGLRLALAIAGAEARIVEASWYGDHAPAVPLGEAFHSRRLRLVASQVGRVAQAMRGRWTHRQRLALALSLLTDPAYDALLEGPTRFLDLPARMPDILRPGGLCHVISYEDA